MSDSEPEEVSADASWRELDQDVNPRTLSSHGRRRVALGVGQTLFFVFLACVAGLGLWEVGRTLLTDTTVVNDPMNTAPLREVIVITDGVLPDRWVEQELRLPKRTPFLDLDLLALRDRLLAHGQIRSVELRRRAPGTLVVTLVERTPVLQLKVQVGEGVPQTLLVARDGLIYEGHGYDAGRLTELPYLDGVRLVRTRRGGFLPIQGMHEVAALVTAAQQNAPDRFSEWRVVSLKRFDDYGEILVKARSIETIVFSRTDDYAKQLGYLAGVYDRVNIAFAGVPLKRVDLSLGNQVPVAFAERPPLSPVISPRIRRDL